MSEKLEGRGTNAERLTALEGAVNQMIDTSALTMTKIEELTKAVSDLAMTVKESKKKPKKPRYNSSSNSEEDDSDKEDESDDSEGSSMTNKSWQTKKKKKGRDALLDCRKLKIPIFNGADVHGWIYKVERYFEFHKFGKKDQLRAVAICLEGAALIWFRWNDAKKPFRSWEGFKRRLLERFQASREGSVQEQFLDIQQTGMVREYVDRFEGFAGQLSNIPESIQESTFIKGLKEEIRAAVRIAEPGSLAQAIRMAIKIDENKVTGLTRGANNSSRTGYGYQGKTNPTTTSAVVKKEDNPPGGFKRLTATELAEKRAKGLCFRCDSKFAPGHKCSSKTLQVLIIDDVDAGRGEEDIDDTWHAHCDMAEVSLNSVSGLTPPRTMKVKGKIGDREVIVLIDSGATHNFVSTQIVDELTLVVTDTGSVGVKLGNGLMAWSYGCCKGVLLDLPEVRIIEEFLPLELGGSDMILGIKWLQTLGDMTVNWLDLRMQYWEGNRLVTIMGDPTLAKTATSCKTLHKLIQQKGEGYLVHIQANEEVLTQAEAPVQVKAVLEAFSDVFKMPVGLPPIRSQNHAITLKDGTPPISVRPYRYLHAQKDEIERLVREMLDAGIIQPSTSPFSSPVLLVKKKDGS
ncbi:hypothetical protein OSB04_un000758 [Centaurea solstitialis]|uniref:Retrotransposon gag domain-containing protein n=1 Tax=Centaurea solstitialis TaxID=347529 RepID=A0AA38SBZ3_9ASTR|nr:hypothetical protein OSB04_un000758 [Centaurea solstitialis]